MAVENFNIKSNSLVLHKEVLDILKDIFENTNKWLLFAESKNAALIGIDGLFLFKAVDYLFETIKGKLMGNIFVVGSIIIIFMLAIILAVISFFPNTSIVKHAENELENNSDDGKILIFFEHISSYKNPSLYLKDIYNYYLEVNVEINDFKKLELDYAEEILVNSKITSYKYRFFKYAMKLNLIAVLLFCIFLLIA